MTIYASGKATPYAYKLVHRVTGQFYFGSRYSKGLNLPSHIDFPQYQSSSKVIKALGFENFEWQIMAEFFDGKDAYDFEHRQIKEHWGNPLLLNQHYVDVDAGRKRFYRNGNHKEVTKAKIAAAHVGKKASAESKAKQSASRKGRTVWNAGKKLDDAYREAISLDYIVTFPDGHEEQIRNMRQFCLERDLSPCHMSAVVKGKRPHHKGYKAVIVG